MPNLRQHLMATQRAVMDSEGDRNAEAVRLFMPSDIADRKKRENACALGLPEVEAELRVGEAREALEALRQGLRTRTMTNRFRLRHCTGQRMLTRGQGILRQINLKIHKAKLRYRYARNALLRLRGHGSWEQELKVLEDSDVRALNERALTAEEAERRRAVHDYEDIAEEGGVAAFGVVALGEGHRTLSWIWYTAKSDEPSETELVEALRVEWCKAMDIGWHPSGKKRGAARIAVVEEELLEGLKAYAREQATREKRTCASLTANWGRIRERGRAYLAGEMAPGVEVIVPLDDEEREPDEDHEGPPDYEDEGDDELLE
ncbi:hypothetical protein B0H14DRAFT_3628195 [Mycena olivaceomarginata]|nr:hypothetical protein B0H14DRAFT_3628195 [Mycena olivaceomarginata]